MAGRSLDGVRAQLRRSRILRGGVNALRHRGLREDDVLIASYPRSGNTWIRFLLADLATGEQADFESIERLIPAVGYHRDAPELAAGARLIKTHERHRREYRRGVYLVRDARDVLISWYRVTRTDPDDLSELDRFVADFVTHRGSQYGSWEDHVHSWLAARDRLGDAILIERFEDLRRDPAGMLERVARFAGIEYDAERLAQALERNSPDAMRRMELESTEFLRRSFGYRSRGVRTGAVGGWRELLSERHLQTLEPALALNRELGYGED